MRALYRGIETEEVDSLGGTVCDAWHCMNFPEGYFPQYRGGPFYFCPQHQLAADNYVDSPAVEQPRRAADEERQSRFSSHDMDEWQIARATEIRHACLALSERIARLVPYGREQATALTNLEQVMFFSVAGIARETV